MILFLHKNSKIEYTFKSISPKPTHGNGVVSLTMLAPIRYKRIAFNIWKKKKTLITFFVTSKFDLDNREKNRNHITKDHNTTGLPYDTSLAF